MVVTKQRYTFEQWLDLPDYPRYELADGELVEHVSTTVNHEQVIKALQRWLDRAEQAGFGQVFSGPTPVLLDATGGRRNVREPDLCFVRREQDRIITADAIEGVPDLVIDVLSPGTEENDLPDGEKWQDYERFAVAAYWIVDIDTRTVAQYAWQDGHYGEPRLVRSAGLLQSPLFPGLTLPVEALFANLRPPTHAPRGRDPFRPPPA